MSAHDGFGGQDVHHDELYLRGGVALFMAAVLAGSGLSAGAATSLPDDDSEKNAVESYAISPDGQGATWFGDSVDGWLPLYYDDGSETSPAIEWEAGLTNPDTWAQHRQALANLASMVAQMTSAPIDSTTRVALNQAVFFSVHPKDAFAIADWSGDPEQLNSLVAVVQKAASVSDQDAPTTEQDEAVPISDAKDPLEELAATQREIAELLRESNSAPESPWAKVLDQLTTASLAGGLIGAIVDEIYKSAITWAKKRIADTRKSSDGGVAKESTSQGGTVSTVELALEPEVLQQIARNAQQRFSNLLAQAEAGRLSESAVSVQALLALGFNHDQSPKLMSQISQAVVLGMQMALAEHAGLVDPVELSSSARTIVLRFIDQLA